MSERPITNSISRRSVLQKTAVATGGIVWGSLTVAGAPGGNRRTRDSNFRLRGKVSKPDNQPAEGHLLRLRAVSLDNRDVVRDQIILGPGGRFEFGLDEPRRVDLVYWSHRDGIRVAERNAIPDLYWIDRVVVTDHVVNVGNERLPEGHLVNVKVVDQDGNPVEGAGVRLATCDDEDCRGWYGTGPNPTDEAGRFVYVRAEEPGIEMTGPVYTNVYHPDGDWEYPTFVDEASFIVTEPTTHVFEIEI